MNIEGHGVGRIAGRLWKRLPDAAMLRSSSIVFAGTTAARLLGFLFSVAAAQILTPHAYGELAYSLAIVTISSILIGNAPTGLSRFVARHIGNPVRQSRCFSNWFMVVGLMLGLSLLLVGPLAVVTGLSGWMALGLAANVIGIAVLQLYREAQRGLQHFGAMVIFSVVANALQLAAIFAATAVGWRSASLFLIIYGLSSVAALALIHPFAPIALGFRREALAWRRMKAILRFIRPLVVQTVLFALWFGADLICVQRLLSNTAAGNYAAAKTLVTVLYLAPAAIASGVAPRVVRMSTAALRRYLSGALLLTAVTTLPGLALMAVWGRPLIGLVFGSKYPQAPEPLTWLALGMALYGFYLVLESAWVGLGRPLIDAIATGLAMSCTIVGALLLTRPLGLAGAALGFAAGSALELVVIGAYTAWKLYPWPVSAQADHRIGVQPVYSGERTA
jgi:O-antigen/teichoic acid export membrane protein